MNEDSIFLEALQHDSAEARSAFLDQACAGNPELRQSVERLLRAHARADEVLGRKADGLPATVATTVTERVGMQVGPYKLLEHIGEGGFGVVFMAEQHQPIRRRVALKVLKAGMDTLQVVARFEQERQALALMDHPNIAKVLDGGSTSSGRPFFVMELIRGVPITQYCDEKKLTPRQRLELFVPVCQAVQHAHQKGIIHRDIKPTNVLVTMHDGQPLVKVIDFGVAKATGQQLTEKSLFTNFAQLIGTPLYMSPEQAELTSQDIDTRTDIYSLGVLLYELLTGTTPFEKRRFQQAVFDEIRRIIREEEPPKPSTRLSTTDELPGIAANRGLEPKKLSGLVRGELDWIVMKALEKDRNRRYETAIGLAHDIERYLADEPVQACPPSTLYRLRKFARRNKTALATVGGLALAVLLVVGTIGWAVRDRAAREQEAALERAAQEQRIEQTALGALDLSSQYLREGKWQSSLVEARRAESVLASGPASEELRQRVAERLADLDMVLRLEDLRTLSPDDQRSWDSKASDQAFAQAFREYGIDIETLDVDPAARLIARRDIRLELAFALDSWATKGLHDPVGKTLPLRDKKLLGIARAVDSDEWRNRVRAMLERNDSAGLRQLAESQEANQQPAATLNLLATALTNVRQENTAAALLMRTHHRHRDDFRINHQLGNLLLHTTPPQPNDSIRFTQAALALRPNIGGMMHNLALALRRAGRRDEAIAAYRESINARQVQWAPTHNNLGLALFEKGQVEEAMACYRKAIELDPKLPHPYSNIGLVLMDQGKFDEAVAAHRKAIEVQPDYAQPYSNLGTALAAQKKYDEAIAAYRKSIELKPDNANTHMKLGDALAARDKFDSAIIAYRKSIELQPDAHAYNNLGVALNKQVKPDEAIVAYRKAIELKPNFAGFHDNLGNALHARKKLDEAIAAWRKTIELDPDFFETYRKLGAALSEQGKLDEAVDIYRKASELNPKTADDCNELAWLLATSPHPQARNATRAVELATRAVKLALEDGNIRNTLGVALYRAGQWQPAVEALTKSMDLRNGGDSSDWFFLAMAHWQLGHKDEARKRFDKAIEWMDKNQPKNEELRRFRTEAAELLGIRLTDRSTESPSKSNNPTRDSATRRRPPEP